MSGPALDPVVLAVGVGTKQETSSIRTGRKDSVREPDTPSAVEVWTSTSIRSWHLKRILIPNKVSGDLMADQPDNARSNIDPDEYDPPEALHPRQARECVGFAVYVRLR